MAPLPSIGGELRHLVITSIGTSLRRRRHAHPRPASSRVRSTRVPNLEQRPHASTDRPQHGPGGRIPDTGMLGRCGVNEGTGTGSTATGSGDAVAGAGLRHADVGGGRACARPDRARCERIASVQRSQPVRGHRHRRRFGHGRPGPLRPGTNRRTAGQRPGAEQERSDRRRDPLVSKGVQKEQNGRRRRHLLLGLDVAEPANPKVATDFEESQRAQPPARTTPSSSRGSVTQKHGTTQRPPMTTRH